MTIVYRGAMNVPNITCLSSDVAAGIIANAQPGMTVYYTDTKAWKIVKNDLTLVDYQLPVNITVGDLEIGAVEIKNSTDDTRAVVGANGLEVEAYVSTINQPVADAVEVAPYYGTKLIATPGDSEPLVATNTYVNSVIIFPVIGNAGNVYIGTSGVDYSSNTGKQIVLTPTSVGCSIDVPIGYKLNLNKIWLDVAIAGTDGVNFMYLK